MLGEWALGVENGAERQCEEDLIGWAEGEGEGEEDEESAGSAGAG